MKFEAKKQIILAIAEEVRTSNSTMDAIIKDLDLVSMPSFYKWLKSEPELKSIYEAAKVENRYTYNDRVVSLARKKIYEKVEEGNLAAIKYVLDNLSFEFNPNVREIRKVIFTQLIQALTNENLTQKQFETIAERMKQIEMGLGGEVSQINQLSQ